MNQKLNNAVTQNTQLAQKVQQALLQAGLETPLSPNKLSSDQKQLQIAKHMRAIMGLLDLDLNDDSLERTPERIAKMYVHELFSGLNYHNFPKITMIENKMSCNEMIQVKNITLTSCCEHHFIVFDGVATVAYLPKNKIIGLSKINRIVRFFAQRPQVQERLTQQILLALQTLLEIEDVAVRIEAIHYCVKARGVMDATSKTATTALGGHFKKNSATRAEFLHGI